MKKNYTYLFALAAALIVTVPMFASAETLYRQLEIGMRGTDVSWLQTFLAEDNTIYPQGLVTGYFGGLTKSAVSNFQARNGIQTAGRVGPATLPVINAQMSSGMNSANGVTGGRAPLISGINIGMNRNTPTVSWNTDEASRGVLYYSTSPIVAVERGIQVDVFGPSIMTDTSLRTSQSITIPNLLANTTYYYMIHTTDQDGNVSVTWPSVFQTSN